MTWLLTVLGSLTVLLSLRDIFHTLWHPSGFGTICRRTFAVTWLATRLVNRAGRSTELAGPLGILLTVVVWTAMIVVGWALVYLPHMPGGFYFGSALRPAESSDLVASFYLSLVAVATLGFGDVVPATGWLRLLVPIQALVGFVLLTAAISWILQVLPGADPAAGARPPAPRACGDRRHRRRGPRGRRRGRRPCSTPSRTSSRSSTWTSPSTPRPTTSASPTQPSHWQPTSGTSPS